MLRVGKLVATNGLQGKIIFEHTVAQADWLKKDMPIMVELIKGSLVPFFVHQVQRISATTYHIQIEDINALEDAKKMVGKAVYVEDNVIQKEASDSPLAWIGFSIVDTNKGGIGTIEDVIKMGPQWLAKLTINEQEVLIPLVDDWIKDLNIKNKFIRMALPEGLIEIYTQN
ncbi:MAG: hypothetical protein KGN97_05955 [Bacteroidota bacterium]|jgi:16S rRNA processing protein RimM|nr:hypothetical protein [Bacteroidota bacterium]